MANLELVNIIGVLDFRRELDLFAVADLLDSSDEVSNVDYSPEENHWIQSRFKFNKHSRYVAFYRSGSSSLVGCDSFDQLDQLVELVESAMEPVIRDSPTLEITNLVFIADLPLNLDLTRLAVAAGLEQVEFEPEQFPGLIYRGEPSDAILLVFSSGKVVITGVTSAETANLSFQKFREKLEQWGFED